MSDTALSLSTFVSTRRIFIRLSKKAKRQHIWSANSFLAMSRFQMQFFGPICASITITTSHICGGSSKTNPYGIRASMMVVKATLLYTVRDSFLKEPLCHPNGLVSYWLVACMFGTVKKAHLPIPWAVILFSHNNSLSFFSVAHSKSPVLYGEKVIKLKCACAKVITYALSMC